MVLTSTPPRAQGAIRNLLATRVRIGLLIETILQVSSLVLGVGGIVMFLALLGYAPLSITRALWDGSVGSTYALAISLGNSIPLILIGGSVWIAYEAGLFNIGGDGQLQWGGITAAVVAVVLARWPAVIAIATALILATVSGAIWAGVAALLRVTRGASEVISTIMLNYIAVLLVDFLVNGPLRDPANYYGATRTVPSDVQPSVYVGAGLAAISVFIVVYVVRWTKIGLSVRAVGRNAEAAHQAGVPINRVWLAVFLASGGISGLAGGLEIISVQHLVSADWDLNWGLLGIAVAFLSIRRPLLLIPWGIVFGMLQAAGPTLKASASVPDSVVTILLVAPLFVYFLISAGWIRWSRKGHVAGFKTAQTVA